VVTIGLDPRRVDLRRWVLTVVINAEPEVDAAALASCLGRVLDLVGDDIDTWVGNDNGHVQFPEGALYRLVDTHAAPLI
jgi:hypothetical protein